MPQRQLESSRTNDALQWLNLKIRYGVMKTECLLSLLTFTHGLILKRLIPAMLTVVFGLHIM